LCTPPLHDALPIYPDIEVRQRRQVDATGDGDADADADRGERAEGQELIALEGAGGLGGLGPSPIALVAAGRAAGLRIGHGAVVRRSLVRGAVVGGAADQRTEQPGQRTEHVTPVLRIALVGAGLERATVERALAAVRVAARLLGIRGTLRRALRRTARLLLVRPRGALRTRAVVGATLGHGPEETLERTVLTTRLAVIGTRLERITVERALAASRTAVRATLGVRRPLRIRATRGIRGSLRVRA